MPETGSSTEAPPVVEDVEGSEQVAAPHAEAAASCLSVRAAAEVLEELEAAGTALARDLSQLTTVWRDVVQESSESAVDHLLLYDSAAMDLEAKAANAVELGEKLVQSASTLNSELRSMDILAARVKAVKIALHELETLVKPLLR